VEEEGGDELVCDAAESVAASGCCPLLLHGRLALYLSVPLSVACLALSA